MTDAPGARRRRDIEWLARDDVWPYLLVSDRARAEQLKREGLVTRSLADGTAAARRVRRDYPGARPGDIFEKLGVSVHKSGEEPRIAWRHRRGDYQRDPPEVVVYVRALPRLVGLASEFGLAQDFSEERVLDVALAHELYHHVELTTLGRASDRHRLRVRALGLITLRRREPTLDEVAAHAFGRELCQLPFTPAILDLLTVHRDSGRFDALMRRARGLVSDTS